MDPALIASLTVIVLVFTYRYILKKTRGAKYPPGPLGLPGVGSMFSLSPNPSKTYIDFARKYGSVFSIQMGWRDWIIINDYESAREVMCKFSFLLPTVLTFNRTVPILSRRTQLIKTSLTTNFETGGSHLYSAT